MQDQAFRQLVERIKLRSPIEEIVGARVSDLRKKGALYWARCPFHEEKTPSFALDPRKGTWRCFGACGEGGDAISFLQRFEGLSFLDSLRLLGKDCGEEVPDRAFRKRSRGEEERRDQRLDILARAERFYAEKLWGPEGREARAYARGRGFTDEILKSFGSGWSPDRGSPLLETASAQGIDLELLIETGLVRRSDDGRPYDFFRGRWMIPIRDRLGRTVGFGARHLPGDTKALGKYMNTPETSLFHKGQLIFGLDRAAEDVRRKRHLVLVEGYTDVMAAHQAGFDNVAAVLGTSTTQDHAALVRRSGAERVTLVFDGDEAGRRASLRALVGLLPLDLNLEVVSPDAGQDPCDLCLGSSPEDGAERPFQAMLAGAREWFAWLAEDLAQKRGAELARGVDELFAILRRLSRPVEQDARLVQLAGRLGISESALRRQWQNGEAGARRSEGAAARRAAGRQGASSDPSGEGGDEAARRLDQRVVKAFRSLAGAMLLDNSLIPVYGDWESRCPDPDLRAVFGAIRELYESGEEGEAIHSGAVMTLLADHPARDQVVDLEESARTAESPLHLARDQEQWLLGRLRAREERALRQRLAAMQTGALDGLPEEQPRLDPDHSPQAAGEDAAALLKSLHAKLREGRVPASPTATPSPLTTHPH